jgi:hypothetical protein
MTITQFENGYWYATELKTFAEAIGILSANKLRKDELEKAIISFLETGTIQSPNRRSLSKTGIRDVEKGLSLKLPVVNYTNDTKTKDFPGKRGSENRAQLKKKIGRTLSAESLARRAAH